MEARQHMQKCRTPYEPTRKSVLAAADGDAFLGGPGSMAQSPLRGADELFRALLALPRRVLALPGSDEEL